MHCLFCSNSLYLTPFSCSFILILSLHSVMSISSFVVQKCFIKAIMSSCVGMLLFFESSSAQFCIQSHCIVNLMYTAPTHARMQHKRKDRLNADFSRYLDNSVLIVHRGFDISTRLFLHISSLSLGLGIHFYLQVLSYNASLKIIITHI